MSALNEGKSSKTKFLFPVTLAANSTQPVTVRYATANGTAAAGSDYTATSGKLTFNPGETKIITVAVKGDKLYETDETFLLNVTDAVSGSLLARGNGTIRNDDQAPTMKISGVRAKERDSGVTLFNFAVTLSDASGLETTVQYSTMDGTATAPSDYTAVSGTLTIPAGQKKASIAIVVNGDIVYETDETFQVVLSGVNGATLTGTGTALGTIRNDDKAPKVASVAGKTAAAPRAVAALPLAASASHAVATPGGKSTATVQDQALSLLANAALAPRKPAARTAAQSLGSAVDQVIHLLAFNGRG